LLNERVREEREGEAYGRGDLVAIEEEGDTVN